jgi:hypothetical protein
MDIAGLTGQVQTMQDDATKRKAALAAQRQQMLTDQNTASRTADLAAGAARGKQLFGDGTLGRVDSTRAGEVADIIKQRQAQTQGFTPEEQNAFRDQNESAINNNTQTNLRAMRGAQGANGVKGGLAVAQQAQAFRDNAAQKAGVERDLYLKNIDLKRSALDSLEKSTGSARADELSRQQFDIGQANKEKEGQLSTELGYGSLGSSDRAAILQRLAGEDQAAATKDAANNMGKK